MGFKKGIVFFIVGFVLFPVIASGGEIYFYVDSNGVFHFTDSPTDLKKYKPYITEPTRTRVKKKVAVKKRTTREDIYDNLIKIYAKQFSVPFELIKAMIKVESDFNPYAVSRAGAVGLMQLLPETARKMGVRNIWSPAENILGGVKYFRYLLDRFNWDYARALAAYNAGSLRVIKAGGVPEIPETKNYVKKVFYFYRYYIAKELKRFARE